jgi:uncharacterized membrane protein YdbT with pleckstrin-like domain
LIITSIFLLIYRESIISITSGAVFWGCISLFWIIFLTFILLNWIHDELDFLIITDTRIINIKQVSALSRGVTECSLDRIQEVNAKRTGIFQTIFGFGNIYIHTASETSNMIISYAPDPIENARRINKLISEYRNGKSQATAPESPKETKNPLAKKRVFHIMRIILIKKESTLKTHH